MRGGAPALDAKRTVALFADPHLVTGLQAEPVPEVGRENESAPVIKSGIPTVGSHVGKTSTRPCLGANGSSGGGLKWRRGSPQAGLTSSVQNPGDAMQRGMPRTPVRGRLRREAEPCPSCRSHAPGAAPQVFGGVFLRMESDTLSLASGLARGRRIITSAGIGASG
jgi:hypothetical protein